MALLVLFSPIEAASLRQADTVSSTRQGSKAGVLRPKAEFDLSPKDASVVKWSPDSRYVATGGLFNDGIQVFDVSTRKQVMFLKKNMPGSFGLAWSPDGRYIAAANSGTRNFKEQKSVHIWDARTGSLVRSIIGPFNPANEGQNDPRSLAFSPDSKYLAADYVGRLGKAGEYIYVYEVSGGTPVRSFGDTRLGFSSSPLVFSPDGKYLAQGSISGEIRLWDVVTGNLYKSIKAYPYDVTSLAYSPNGQWLATGTSTGGIRGHLDKATGQYSTIKNEELPRIWDVATGQAIKSLPGYTATVKRSLEFTPDGKYLVSGSHDKTIKLWDTGTWQLVDTVVVPDMPASVGVSPNGRYLAAGAGNRLLVWEIARQGQ